MTIDINHQLTLRERRSRVFSEEFKRMKVIQIESNQLGVSELSRQYQVSRNVIYKWIHRYGRNQEKPVRLVIEMDSDSKKLKEALAEIARLKQVIGEQQLQILFKDKVLELIKEEDKVDVKKKSERLRTGSGKTKKN
jgi:transposase